MLNRMIDQLTDMEYEIESLDDRDIVPTDIKEAIDTLESYDYIDTSSVDLSTVAYYMRDEILSALQEFKSKLEESA